MEDIKPPTIFPIDNELNSAPNILERPKMPQKEFSLKTKDNISYNLTILQGENELALIIKKLNDFKDISYKKVCILEEFYNIDKYFKQFENIKQLFSEYFGFLKEDEITIDLKDNKIIIEFKYNTKLKEDKILFILNEEPFQAEKFASNICFEIENIKKENDSNKSKIDQIKEEQARYDENFFQINENIEQKLKQQFEKLKIFIDKSNENHHKEIEELKEHYQKEINYLKKENEELTNLVKFYCGEINKNEELNKAKTLKVSENKDKSNNFEINNFEKLNKENNFSNETENKLNNMIDNMNQVINQFKHDISPLLLFEEKSQIIRYEELDIIQEGITKIFNKRIIKYNLLFRASRDGFRAIDFHMKCDGKDFTIVFVKTVAGRRFGGFTDLKWNKNGGYIRGGNSFTFSLTHKEIYFLKNKKFSIYSDIHYGPVFGDKDFFISDNCNQNNKNYDYSNNSYETNGRLYAFANASTFSVEDYEVYQIILK